MIAFDEALAIVADVAAAHPLPVEARSLSRAHGHVLARNVAAPIALPPFDNSAMDGFALRSADLSADDLIADFSWLIRLRSLSLFLHRVRRRATDGRRIDDDPWEQRMRVAFETPYRWS